MAATAYHTTETGKRRTMFIPVGLPGSGKTWLADRLDTRHFLVISQDLLKCDVATLKMIIENQIKNSRRHLYIDSCNHYGSRRRDLVSLALKYHLQVVFINFRFNEKECRDSVMLRTKNGEPHPSITSTEIADRAFATILERYHPLIDSEYTGFKTEGVSSILVTQREKLQELVVKFNEHA